MSDRIEKSQGQKRLTLRGLDTGSSGSIGDKSPSGKFSSATSQNLYLRGMSDPKTPSPVSPGSSNTPIPRSVPSFNPEAAEFSPTVSSVNTPRSAFSSPADPNSVESSVQKYREAQREDRLRQINMIEDDLDREEAMNDFIWDQHTEWSSEDLAKEKEEKELEERREKYGHHRKDSRK
jgi:hypothetical protein